jgi:hypothetical protein
VLPESHADFGGRGRLYLLGAFPAALARPVD